MNNQNKFNQNQIESQVNPWEISDADLNHINLEHLNNNAEAERVRNEIEQSRDISVFHIEGLNQNAENLADNREAVLDIYEKTELSGRENSNIFQERRQESQDNVIYLADYGAGFDGNYGSREEFIARNENRNLSQQELNRKVIDLKQEKRKTNQDLGRKVFKALTGDISA
jgi:hypothetical protein